MADYPDRIADLAEVTPVYETLPGWHTELRACRHPDQLPGPARQLIDLVEREVSVPVAFVGVGPDRDDVIRR